jgi:UDP-N-acetylglucosamine 2-epimerase (non-hydrolysing)
MIDTLVRMRSRIGESGVHDLLGVERGAYVLVTLHRPSLVDGNLLSRTLDSLARLALAIRVVFPVHPRTRAKIPPRFDAPNLQLVEPLGYIDFLALETHAAAVITDSGGVQEETTYLQVPCFTLRANTERPITIEHGTNTLLGLDPEAVERLPELLASPPRASGAPAGWDGNAARRLADVLAADLRW